MKKLLSGNEALARGALEARIEIACGYPGTPSSEILENVSKYKEIYSEWSVNEKVAMDAAAGAAYSGRRALVTTKQVGMNVMSDSLFYTAYTGAEAALVVVTADDPGLFSSQNEQDNRHYAKLGKFPMLEPCDSQECKDFMGEAVARLSDVAVLTSDNPRHEEPEAIMADVMPGLSGAAEVFADPDRRRAIEKGLELLHPGDALLIAGKGHESTQQIGDVKHPFSDQQTVREILGCA